MLLRHCVMFEAPWYLVAAALQSDTLLFLRVCIYVVTVHGTHVGVGMIRLIQPCGVCLVACLPAPLEEQAQGPVRQVVLVVSVWGAAERLGQLLLAGMAKLFLHGWIYVIPGKPFKDCRLLWSFEGRS